MMKEKQNSLKDDWVECTLGDVCFTTSGGTPSRQNKSFYEGNIPWVKSGELDKGIIFDTEEHISEEAIKKSSAKIFPKGTLLFALYGATIGKMATLGVDASTNQAICGIYKSKVVQTDYLFHYLFHKKRDLIRQGKGGAQPNISQTIIKSLDISIPPLTEQKAIVKKIEQLFSSLDSGIADLQQAQAQLKIYRQAVLKKAFEGELTKEWRANIVKTQDIASQLPTADELLEQIKEERQNHYNNQIEEWKKAVKSWEENGKVGKKPSKPKIYKTVEPFSAKELKYKDKICKIWKWVKLGNIFNVYVGSTPSRRINTYWENGDINWVSSGEVAFKSINNTKESITELGLQNASTTVHPIGTVMLAMIGEGKTRGQAGILKIEACHNQNTAAIRVSEIGLDPNYLYHYLFLQYEKNRRVGSGNNQKALNQGRIMNFDYPLCSKVEQTEIVRQIESRLSVCDKVEKDIALAIERSRNLRQSILKKAFEGKLLSAAEIAECKKAKDYEPASVLLERIKNEKLGMMNAKKKKK